jgi:hypothetical protein
MGRTVNRRPLSVNTPGKSDLQEYYFTHSNWKGLSDEKNYLTVDQETFSDCKNVYVNTEGLLCSRPPVVKNEKLSLTEDYTIQDFWIFENIAVYFTTSNSLIIRNVNSSEELVNIHIDNSVTLLQPIKVENKIYVFAESIDYFYVYDIDSKEFKSAKDDIYVPLVEHYINNVKQSNVEDENELTSSRRVLYEYENLGYVNFVSLYGKTLNTKIDGEEYSITYNSKLRDLLIGKVYNTAEPSIFTEDDDIVGPHHSEKISMMDISDDGVIAFYECVDKSNGSWIIRYTSNYIYTDVLEVTGVLCKPWLTKNSQHIIVAKEDGLYAYGILQNSEGYGSWFNIFAIRTGVTVEQGKYINAHFEDIDHYYFVFPNDVSEAEPVDEVYGLHAIGRKDGETIYYNTLVRDTRLLASRPIIKYNRNGVVFLTSSYDEEGLYVLGCTIFKQGSDDIYVDGTYNIPYVYPIDCDLYLYSDRVTIIGCSESEAIFAEIFSPFGNFSWWYSFSFDGHRKLVRKFNSTGTKILGVTGVIDASTKELSKAYWSEAIPIDYNNYTWLYKDEYIQSSNSWKNIKTELLQEGSYNNVFPLAYCELTDYYFASDKKLYISKYPSQGDFKWYFPKINTEHLDYNICNLIPTSQDNVSLFTTEGIYNITKSVVNDKEVYVYNKSKFDVKCKFGMNAIYDFTGENILFTTDRGLSIMSYQQLVASTEQKLNFVSDIIQNTYTSIQTSNTFVLEKFKFWILCYCENILLLFDTRNMSWWKWEFPLQIDKLLIYEDKILIFDKTKQGSLHNIDFNEFAKYKDVVISGALGEGLLEYEIDWMFKSQKLHLNAINNYKHISNIVLSSVLESTRDEPLDLDLIVTNYRKIKSVAKTDNFTFKVDTIRIYVKRLNYVKVNEFQYELRSNSDNVLRIPLSLSNVTIKYKISGQVR